MMLGYAFLRIKRMRQHVRYFAIIVATALLGTMHSEISIAANSTCLDYEPATDTLTGTITRHMEYGPPNYGEDPTHDAKELYWYLELDDPIRVNGREESPDMEAEENIRKLQIVYLNGYPKDGDWIGHRASITGTLFHAISGHHHTNLLITADKTTKMP